jgi:hypothetical protein
MQPFETISDVDALSYRYTVSHVADRLCQRLAPTPGVFPEQLREVRDVKRDMFIDSFIRKVAETRGRLAGLPAPLSLTAFVQTRMTCVSNLLLLTRNAVVSALNVRKDHPMAGMWEYNSDEAFEIVNLARDEFERLRTFWCRECSVTGFGCLVGEVDGCRGVHVYRVSAPCQNIWSMVTARLDDLQRQIELLAMQGDVIEVSSFFRTLIKATGCRPKSSDLIQ